MSADHETQLERFRADSEALGLGEDLLFQSTLERYEKQIDLLAALKAELDTSPATVQREYVKGSPSTYANPLIGEFNKAANAANQTCGLLAKLRDAAAAKVDDEDFDYEL